MKKNRRKQIKKNISGIRTSVLLAVLTAGVLIAGKESFPDGKLSASYTETAETVAEISNPAPESAAGESADFISAESDTVPLDNESTESESAETALSALEVHFIDVGQGDSALIVCGGEAMLIDAGDNSKGTTIQLYLTKQDIKNLKYVIGTHPDADHIGGLDVILYKYDCETIIMPGKTSDSAIYRDVIDVMENKGYKISDPQVGDAYALGDAVFTILGPSRDYSDDNNCSVIIRLTHGENVFLFTGDAEEEAERDLLDSGQDISAAVLKVGHHGSSTSTCADFLEAVSPRYAVISCGAENAYGHPHAETLEKLQNAGCQIFRTDEQGSIVAYSDGTELTWSFGLPE